MDNSNPLNNRPDAGTPDLPDPVKKSDRTLSPVPILTESDAMVKFHTETLINKVGIENRLLKAADVAHLLNISKTHAYRLMKNEIPVFRVGAIVRVCVADLERFIDENKKNGGNHEKT